MILDEEEIFKQRRELGEDEDLELAIDHDQELQEKDLRTKVLFAIQGLGSVRTVKRRGRDIEAYIKGQYCEQSIKDLVKHIRKDVPENPKVNLILSQFNIIESDLIKILILHEQDKKLSFWLLALMSYITMKPSEGLSEVQTNTLYDALKQYKKSFMKNQGITYLIVHIHDYVKTPVEKRQKAHIQMMQFIIILMRNLLELRNEDMSEDQLHSHFLIALVKQDMMGPLLYLIQKQKGQLMGRVQILLLEIFYHIFTCFDPVVLYGLNPQINLREQSMRLANKKVENTRHSRFMPNFVETNKIGVTRVTHTLNKKDQPLAGQRKVPNRRAQLKKVKKIQREYIEQNFLEIEFEQPNEQTKTKTTIKKAVFEYAEQFAQVSFEMLSKLVFDSIYRQVPRINKQNIMQYLLLCSWEIKMTRSKYYHAKKAAKTPQEQGMVEFDLGQILFIMQTGHFQLIYKLLFREATREKKKQFDINMFHAALILFLNYIEVIEDISKSFNMNDRKNANALMANMFRHDIARIFKIGFHQITHEKILQTLIVVNYKFFKLLSEYSKGKVLTIQTNKLLKQKKNKKKLKEEDDEQEIKGFISEDSDAQNQGNMSDSYNQDEQEAKPKKKQQQKIKNYEEEMEAMRFQQRKFNQMTQFAVVADYQIISKYLIFLKNDKYLDSPHQLNNAIFFYFQRICQLLKGQWLFYQAETLVVFNKLLNDPIIAKQYRSSRATIKKICESFVKLLRTNKLALVQSLFRYSNISLKEQILRNYGQMDNKEDQGFEQIQKNMYIDE